MLNYLAINNFALIEKAELEFSGGFTVVTGESGSGKSILMSAIELLTGGRAERSGIRSGCKHFTVSGEFSVPDALFPEIHTLLESAGIEISPEDKILQLRRVIGINSTRNFINDIPVSAKLLADTGSRLIDLHGANEQISLTVPARQLELLDNFGNTGKLKDECAKIHRELKMLAQEKADFEADLPDAAEADRYAGRGDL